MLPQRPQGAKTNTHGLPPFFNLTENKFYNINVHPHHHPSDYKVVGSLEGWLVIVSKLSRKPFIVYPFSPCIIPLPTIITTSIKSNNKTRRTRRTRSKEDCICKAIIPPHFYSNMRSFLVVVIYGLFWDRLAFIKGTDETWTKLYDTHLYHVYVDIIFP